MAIDTTTNLSDNEETDMVESIVFQNRLSTVKEPLIKKYTTDQHTGLGKDIQVL